MFKITYGLSLQLLFRRDIIQEFIWKRIQIRLYACRLLNDNYMLHKTQRNLSNIHTPTNSYKICITEYTSTPTNNKQCLHRIHLLYLHLHFIRPSQNPRSVYVRGFGYQWYNIWLFGEVICTGYRWTCLLSWWAGPWWCS